MAKFTMTHEINCTPETFWKLFLDQEFTVDLYKKGLDFPEFEIKEQRETDKELVRRSAGKPKLNMPGPVMKLLGDGFKYVEDATLDKASKTWRWKMTPSTLAEKMRNEGTMRIEAVGDKKCRRIADIVIEAKIFGLGGLMESAGEKSLREGWDKSAVYMNKWIADKGLT